VSRELSEKLDEAQDQLQELESTNRSLQGVQRLVEQYRNKVPLIFVLSARVK